MELPLSPWTLVMVVLVQLGTVDLQVCDTTQLCTIFLTNCLPHTNQYLDLTVSFAPLCLVLSWARSVIKIAKWCCLLNKIGCFLEFGISTLVNLPPHLHTFCWSRNSYNQLQPFHNSNFASLVRHFWQSITQSNSACSISAVACHF